MSSKTVLDLINRDEVVEDLGKILARLDIERPEYQVDVYLYIDEDGKGELDEFVNVGGNSWLADDHITVARIGQCYDSIEELYDSIEELCDAAGIDAGETLRLIAESKDWGVEDVDYDTVQRYIEDNYHDEIVADYLTWRDESAFYAQAEALIEQAEACAEEDEE